MTMHNFTAADMPGTKEYESANKPAPKKTEESAPAEKKTPTKKPAAKKAEPKVEEKKAPVQTDTETHGVGPSTVEGEKAEDKD